MKKTNKKRKGFTLIELIVVIAILAILAAVAVPNFIGLIDKANTAVEIATAAEYANAINIYNALNSDAPITSDTEDIPGTLDDLAPATDGDVTVADALARITIADGIATVTDKE